MANNDFIVEIVDASTSLPLPTINIGNRTYISAEGGITFHIKCACRNIKKYTKKGKKLSCKVVFYDIHITTTIFTTTTNITTVLLLIIIIIIIIRLTINTIAICGW